MQWTKSYRISFLSCMQILGLFDWSEYNPMPLEFWFFPSFIPMHPGLSCSHILQKHLLLKPSSYFPFFGIAMSSSTFFSLHHLKCRKNVLLLLIGLHAHVVLIW